MRKQVEKVLNVQEKQTQNLHRLPRSQVNLSLARPMAKKTNKKTKKNNLLEQAVKQ